MTDEEIIERACDEHHKACHCCQMDWECDEDIRKRVAVLIRADERERCAKAKGVVCPFCGEDDLDLIGLDMHLTRHCKDRHTIAAAIRAGKVGGR